jgi:RNA polymerase-interacting CarD/CdnL/TRCF family regulator
MISRDTDMPKEHMFEIGDAVVHPVRGAGIVTDIAKLKRREGSRAYYKIRLLNHARTHLLLPIRDALAKGLRRAIRRTRLAQVWRVLRSTPDRLPSDYKKRHALLKRQIESGDILKVAAAVRDLAWRQKRQDRLTITGQRIYQQGISMLAGEIAAAQGVKAQEAEAQVMDHLIMNVYPRSAQVT